jgi:hypothetical protein
MFAHALHGATVHCMLIMTFVLFTELISYFELIGNRKMKMKASAQNTSVWLAYKRTTIIERLLFNPQIPTSQQYLQPSNSLSYFQKT